MPEQPEEIVITRGDYTARRWVGSEFATVEGPGEQTITIHLSEIDLVVGLLQRFKDKRDAGRNG